MCKKFYSKELVYGKNEFIQQSKLKRYVSYRMIHTLSQLKCRAVHRNNYHLVMTRYLRSSHIAIYISLRRVQIKIYIMVIEIILVMYFLTEIYIYVTMIFRLI